LPIFRSNGLLDLGLADRENRILAASIIRANMLKTKLIMVEGLPGSGKSSTAQYIAMQMENNGFPARWFHEAEKPHPIHARDVLRNEGKESFVERSINNWLSFVTMGDSSCEISVLEAMLFQCLVGALLSGDMQPQRITDIVFHIQEITRPLDPVLIYFRHNDVAKATRKTYDLRGKTLEQRHIQWFENTSFAQNRQLQGFDGLAAYLQLKQDLTDRLFNRLDLKKLVIENSAGDWEQYYRQILGFLSLERFERVIPEGRQNKFVGIYRGEDAQHECVIEKEDGYLAVSISIMPRSRLIPKGENSFYVVGAPIELLFQEDASSVVCRMEQRVLWEWDLDGKVLAKVGEGSELH